MIRMTLWSYTMLTDVARRFRSIRDRASQPNAV